MTNRTTHFRGRVVLLSLLAALALILLSIPAATASGAWTALYGGDEGEEMEGVWVTSDGGFIVTGATGSYRDENGDAWIIKLDTSSEVDWQRTYGGEGVEYAIDIKETGDGGYIVVGWTSSFGAGQEDFWVFKLDEVGDIVWEKTYGGEGVEQAWSVDLTRDGGFVVAGGTTSFGAGGADYWVLKLDGAGNILWQKTYGGPDDDGGGGAYEEYVVRVLEDEDGNYVLASHTLSFGAGEYDIWVVKLDPDGEILWQKAYGGRYGESLWSFQETSGGGYIVPGVSVSFSPDESGDLWVLKLDKDGDIEWQRIYGVTGYWDEALSVGATSNGGSIIGGYYEEGSEDWDLFLLRLDSSGNALWQRVYEYGWDWPNAVQQLKHGGYVVVGVTWPYDQGLPEDLWVMRLAEDGTIGSSCDIVRDISLERVETDAEPADTTAVVRDTGVTPLESSAFVQDTSAAPDYLCQTVGSQKRTDEADGAEGQATASPETGEPAEKQPPTGGTGTSMGEESEGTGVPVFAALVCLLALLVASFVALTRE